MEKRIQFRRQERSDLQTQFWLRTIAFTIDNFIIRLLIIPIIVYGLLLFRITLSEELSDISTDILLYSLRVNSTILIGLYFFVFILYTSIMESSRLQATIGKWFLRYKVYDTDFNKISFQKALLRNSLKVISILSLIGVVIIDMTPKRQGLHDIIVKTVLIRR
jgi:uncharacterized RDD family membrane protein YckC